MLSHYEAIMEEKVNPKLKKGGHAPMIKEELITARLYSGPMCACALFYGTLLPSVVRSA